MADSEAGSPVGSVCEAESVIPVEALLLDVEGVLVEDDEVVDGVVVEEVEEEEGEVEGDVVVVVVELLGLVVWKLIKLVLVICPSVTGAARVMSSTPSRPQQVVVSLLLVLQQ